MKGVRETRGRSPQARSLFTTFGNFIAPEMRFTAEIVAERKVEDDLGVPSEASISTLRYEVAFRLIDDDGAERLELIEESLLPISLEAARKSLAFPSGQRFKDSILGGRRSAKFISTERKAGGHQIRIHQEGHGGRVVPPANSKRTIVGAIVSSDYPTILAAHREMESWRTLLLEPSAMRSSAGYSDPRFIDARGANLPGALERLRKGEARPGQVFATVANRLAELVDGIRELRIEDDPRTETLTLEVRGKDDVFRPARSLSDGTLRFLVLAGLAVDSDSRGILCIEEPENGIHPHKIGQMMQLLRDIAVDTSLPIDKDNPLRQMLVNTHSPVVVQNVQPSDLIYIDEARVVINGSVGKVAVLRVPVGSWRAQEFLLPLAPGQILSYFPEEHDLWDEFVAS